jgi:glycosyltransferase involved in cell wall biosynthesis
MPAYNAEKTLVKTYRETMAERIVDEIVLVDDASTDRTVEIARHLNKVHVHVHAKNVGYGGNQKSCFNIALEKGADIVIMIHPDYQYTPKLIPAMAGMIVNDLYSCVLGSRILGGGALRGGMPYWRYVANRLLTFTQNLLLGETLSEYHTGYRAYSRELLKTLPLDKNSDDFIFDNEMLAEAFWAGFRLGEVSCPTSYHSESSSITFARAVRYGFACLGVGMTYRLAKWGIIRSERFPKNLRNSFASA